MFKPNLVIPNKESIKVDKELFDTLARQMILTPISKESVMNRISTAIDTLIGINSCLERNKSTPKEAHAAYMHEIYATFITHQLEEYVEQLPSIEEEEAMV